MRWSHRWALIQCPDLIVHPEWECEIGTLSLLLVLLDGTSCPLTHAGNPRPGKQDLNHNQVWESREKRMMARRNVTSWVLCVRTGFIAEKKSFLALKVWRGGNSPEWLEAVAPSLSSAFSQASSYPFPRQVFEEADRPSDNPLSNVGMNA